MKIIEGIDGFYNIKDTQYIDTALYHLGRAFPMYSKLSTFYSNGALESLRSRWQRECWKPLGVERNMLYG